MPCRVRGPQGQASQPQLETVHQVPNMPPLGLLEGIRPALNPVSSWGLEKPGMERWGGLSLLTPASTSNKTVFPVVPRPAWPTG